MSTSNLFVNCSLKPRAETAQVLALICDTSTPGTMRNRSGILVAPEWLISSWVITKIAAAAWEIFWAFLETEVTSMFIKSSRDTWERSRCPEVCSGRCGAGCGERPNASPARIENVKKNNP